MRFHIKLDLIVLNNSGAHKFNLKAEFLIQGNISARAQNVIYAIINCQLGCIFN